MSSSLSRVARRVAAGVAATAVAFALAGCAPSAEQSGDSSAPAEKLNIVASTTQVADFTRQVAGDDADVTQIIQPNQSAHDIELTAANKAAIEEADVVVINGVGLDDVVKDAAKPEAVVDTSEGVELIQTAEEEHEHAEGEEEHAEEEHAEDEHAEGGMADNPHIWTVPANAKIMVQNIEKALAAKQPEQASVFEENANAYEAKLDTLQKWTEDTFAPVPEKDRTFVSTHDAFPYFVQAFGITQNDSVLGSLDDHAEPSQKEIDELVAKIKESGVKAVFSEASINPKLSEAVARDAGVKVYSGDDALYGDSLGPAGSEGETYLEATVHNVTLIAESWGQKATAPSGL